MVSTMTEPSSVQDPDHVDIDQGDFNARSIRDFDNPIDSHPALELDFIGG